MKEVSRSKVPEESPRPQWSARGFPKSAVLMVVALVHLTIVLPSISPAPHNGGDNAGYLSLAHSMAGRRREGTLFQISLPCRGGVNPGP